MKSRSTPPGVFDADVDNVGLGVTILLGSREHGVLLKSVADTVITPRHDALSTLFDSVF
jgi:hypothetical protein